MGSVRKGYAIDVDDGHYGSDQGDIRRTCEAFRALFSPGLVADGSTLESS